MTPDLENAILALFLIFCRIGSCLMLLPGYSSVRIPANIRLFIAVAVALAVSPNLLPGVLPLVSGAGDDARLVLIFGEILNGLLIGLLGRIFTIALQFAGHLVANAIGMGQTLGVPIDEAEPAPALVSLITMSATALIFALNLHAEVLQALVASYKAVPVALGFAGRGALASIVDNLDLTFTLCLRIASPFVIYAVVVNFAIGLANKMTPQIPIYFISLPFVLAGGLVLVGYALSDFLIVFVEAFRQWVLRG